MWAYFILEALYYDYVVGDIFKTVISIYAQGDNYKLLPLPSLEEVLICDQNTTVEEVNWFYIFLVSMLLLCTTCVYYTYVCCKQISLLWYRAVRDPEHKRIFCLVNGEKLPYQVCVEAFERMDQILTGETGRLFTQCYVWVMCLAMYRLSAGYCVQ